MSHAQRQRQYGSFTLEIDGRRLYFRTQAGVFSPDAVDDGTSLLLHVLLPLMKPHMTVLDLGTGVGVVGIALASLVNRGEVWMTDVDVRAVRLAQFNMVGNNVENGHVLLSDITLDLPQVRFDLVVSNPPTHSGKEVLASIVSEAYGVLRPGGHLYVVVNRLLSIKDMMSATFGNVELADRRKGFIVLHSHKERRRPVR